MKKYILRAVFLLCGIVLLPSCKKGQETKYVTLNEAVKSGTTYSLDLTAYGERNAEVSITTQATDYTTSQVDRDTATGRNIYHFSTDTKIDEKETVVLNVKDNKGHCSHDEQKTVITINFTIDQ